MLHEETRAIQEAAILLQNEGKLITAPGARIRIKVFSEHTGGRFSLIDYQADPAYAGPPPHWHKQMTELFYVLEGELTLQVGNSTFTANAGTSAFIPTGTVHKFSNPSAQSVRFLIVCSPGGFEHYFEEMIEVIGKAGGSPVVNSAKVRRFLMRNIGNWRETEESIIEDLEEPLQRRIVSHRFCKFGRPARCASRALPPHAFGRRKKE